MFSQLINMLLLLDAYPCEKACEEQYIVCRSNGGSEDKCVSKIMI